MSNIRQYLTEAKGLEIYKNDVIVKRGSMVKMTENNKSNKSAITTFSRQARRHLAFVASNTDIEFTTMITLTYPKVWESNGKVVKAHFKRFKQCLTRRFKCHNLWFLEFQRRGAPHFHIMTNQGRYSKEDIRWIAESWYRIVGSNDVYHLDAGTQIKGMTCIDGLRHYVVKYMAKMYQKNIPKDYRNVGRLYGYSKGVKPSCKMTIELLGDDDMIHYLSDWEYIDRIRDKPIKVLFNASKHVR